MTGAFACCPLVCWPCAETALAIVRRKPSHTWGAETSRIEDDKTRRCVGAFLRGVRARETVALAAAEQLEAK